MINLCFVCGGDHPFKDCPSIQPPGPPPPPSTDPQREEPTRSSLAPTQFEELFGVGAEGLLQDVLDRPDVFSGDQQDLALAILGGDKDISTARGEDRTRLDEMARQLASLKPPPPKAPAKVVRPAYIRTQEEMEEF